MLSHAHQFRKLHLHSLDHQGIPFTQRLVLEEGRFRLKIIRTALLCAMAVPVLLAFCQWHANGTILWPNDLIPFACLAGLWGISHTATATEIMGSVCLWICHLGVLLCHILPGAYHADILIFLCFPFLVIVLSPRTCRVFHLVLMFVLFSGLQAISLLESIRHHAPPSLPPSLLAVLLAAHMLLALFCRHFLKLHQLRQRTLLDLLNTDTLSGLPNRALLQQRLGEAQEPPGLFAILSMGNLPEIGRTLGEEDVSRAIVGAARLIRTATEGFGGEAFYLSRGDFALVLPDYDSGLIFIKRFLRGHTPVLPDAQEPPLHVPLQAGLYRPKPHDSLGTLLSHANRALQQARFTQEPLAEYEAHTVSEDRRRLNREKLIILNRNLQEGTLRCWFQPIVDNSTGHISHLEALMRCHHPDRGTESIFPYLEPALAGGFYPRLTHEALKQACQASSIFDLPVSVNISPHDLRRPGFIREVEQSLQAHPPNTVRLILEILEHEELEDIATDDLLALRSLGCMLALDDFGSGYANFTNLSRLPLDMVKLDGRLVRKLATDPSAQTLVESICLFCSRCGLTTVAEQVETPEILIQLRNLGIQKTQGYLFSPPPTPPVTPPNPPQGDGHTPRQIPPCPIVLVQCPVPDGQNLYHRGNIPLAGATLLAWYRSHSKAPRQAHFLSPTICNQAGDALLVHQIMTHQPAAVLFSVYLWNVERSLFLSQAVKRKNPETIIIWGGPELAPRHPWLGPAPAGVDVLVSGEGERLLTDLLDGTHPLPPDQNRWLRDQKPLDLARCPNPYLSETLALAPGDDLWLESMRGCPYRCAYCYYAKSAEGVRFFPPDRLPGLLQLAQERQVAEIYLMDPSLDATPDLEQRLETMARLNTSGIPIHTEIRLERVSPQLARAMSQAGIRSVEAGLQSTNAQALSACGRTWNKERFVTGVRALQDVGISIKTGLIAGLPHDRQEDILASVSFVRQLGLDDMMELYPLSLLPGTRFHQNRQSLGLESQSRPPYWIQQTPDLSREALVHTFRMIEEELDIDLFPAMPPLPLPTGVQETLGISLLDLRPLNRPWPGQADVETLARGLVFLWDGSAEGDRCLFSWLNLLAEETPHAQISLILDRDRPPGLGEARAWFERLRWPEGYLDRTYTFAGSDPQPSRSCRFFWLVRDAARFARSLGRTPPLLDTLLCWNPSWPEGYLPLLEAQPFLALPDTLPDAIRRGIGKQYEGLEHLIWHAPGSL